MLEKFPTYKERYPLLRKNLLSDLKSSFVQTVDEYFEEFVQKEGMVTCEFYTSGDNLADKIEFLAWHTSKLAAVGEKSYYWRVYYCSTCSKYGEQAFHCRLMFN